jgi:hypothetical protein
MSTRTAWARANAPVLVASILLVLGSGTGALLQGQDANLDLYRYRLYIGYAFLNDRLDQDLAPAALGTFLNPVLDAFHYAGIARVPPRVFGFAMGCLQGMNAVVVLLLALRLLPVEPGRRRLAVLAAFLAASGPTARSLLGTTLGDTVVSLPALVALLLTLRGQACTSRGCTALHLLAAGWLAGAAMGLKLTMATTLGALGAVVALGLARGQIAIGAALACLLGAALGYLAIAGYWCWQLWRRFANPIFPFANQIFQSPYLPAEPIRDERWAAHDVLDYLSPAIDMALGTTARLQEIPFRDARFVLVLAAALAWLALRLLRRRPAAAAGLSSLLAYSLAGSALWALAFYYYRYAATFEYLAPLLLVVLTQAVLGRRALSAVVAMTALLVATSSVGSWGRLPWGEQWFNIRLPPQAREPDTLVLLDSSLSSFLIPYFPPQTRFAGLEGLGSERFDDLLAARVASHRGPLLWLAYRGRHRESARPDHLGLVVTDDCGVVRTGEGRWALCRLVRSGQPNGAPDP